MELPKNSNDQLRVRKFEIGFNKNCSTTKIRKLSEKKIN